MPNSLGEAERLIAHSLRVEEALGLAQLKAVEISTAHSGKWDELLEDALRTQRCAAPRAFEQRLTILMKFLRSVSSDPAQVVRDIEAEGLAMLSAADICKSDPDRWIDCAKEVVRKMDIRRSLVVREEADLPPYVSQRPKRKCAIARRRLAH